MDQVSHQIVVYVFGSEGDHSDGVVYSPPSVRRVLVHHLGLGLGFVEEELKVGDRVKQLGGHRSCASMRRAPISVTHSDFSRPLTLTQTWHILVTHSSLRSPSAVMRKLSSSRASTRTLLSFTSPNVRARARRRIEMSLSLRVRIRVRQSCIVDVWAGVMFGNGVHLSTKCSLSEWG